MKYTTEKADLVAIMEKLNTIIMKEKLIELFTKIGNETDTFAPFVTCDQFENLADEIVKLCNLQNVSNNEVAACDHVWINGRVTVGTEVCIKCNEARLKQTDC